MENRFYNKDTGINWSNVADTALSTSIAGLTTGGIGALAAFGGSLIKGGVSDMFNKKSEKRALKNYGKQLALDYIYAQKYAENGPSWQVKGLRDAGINPMLPYIGSSPSTPTPHAGSYSPSKADTSSDVRYDPLTLTALRGLDLDNQLKSDNLATIKKENEVRRLKAEAEADLLRPVEAGSIQGDSKSVGVLLPSKAFKALQKGIADDYDLKSERYIRETADAVMKYGLDVLKLLPFVRRTEILKKIIFDKNSNGPNSGHPATTATRNGPGSDPVFQYD